MTYTLTITRDQQTTPTVEVTDPQIRAIVSALQEELLRTKTARTHVTVTGATGPWTLILRPNMEDPTIDEFQVEEHARDLSGFLHWDADYRSRQA